MNDALNAEQAVAAERDRIARLLTLPLLAAIRCIPDGRIQKGCVVSDGTRVRENVRQAYLAVRDGLGQPPVHQELADLVLAGVRDGAIQRRAAVLLLEIAGLDAVEATDRLDEQETSS